MILFSLALPPALIFASRRSLRMRACSAARAAAASSGLIPAVSVMVVELGWPVSRAYVWEAVEKSATFSMSCEIDNAD